MKKMMTVATLGALALSGSALAKDLKIYGYGQVNYSSGEGSAVQNSTARGSKFSLGRVRLKLKNTYKKTSAFVQYELNTGKFKDVKLGYKCPLDRFNMTFGQFKTPIGHDQLTSSGGLDIVTRGYDYTLSFQRNAGFMLDGKVFGDLRYFVGVFGANTVSATKNANTVSGRDSMYVANLTYNARGTEIMAAYAKSGNDTKGTSDEDTTIINFFVGHKMGALNLKAEYIAQTSIKGLKDANGSSLYAHVGYMLSNKFEVVARYYANSNQSNNVAKTKTNVGNTHIGFNYWPEKESRFQVNYILASGDKTKWGGFASTGGAASSVYTADAIVGQYQVKF